MNRVFTTFFLSLLLCFFFISSNTMAMDGKTLFTKKLCFTCHGPDGKAPVLTIYPILAGQNETYLFQQMQNIRDGKRTNGMAATMRAIVAPVTDDEFKTIAKYLSGLSKGTNRLTKQ